MAMNLDEDKLRDTLKLSLGVLETAGDPVVVDEAKKIENVVSQLIEVTKEKTPEVKDTATGYFDNVKKFNETMVEKYGLVAARIIEFVMILLIAAKVYFLG